MFVKPGMWRDAPEGEPRQMLVRHPNRRPLRAEGEHVPDDGSAVGLFWHRRLRDGDVVLCDPPAEPAAEQPKESVARGDPEPIAEPETHSAAFVGDHPAELAVPQGDRP